MTPTQPIPTWTQTAINNTLAMVVAQVATLNAGLTSIFKQAFANWSMAVVAGVTPNTTPPAIPNAYVVGPTDANGFATIAVGSAPVCAMLPIPSGPGAPAALPTAVYIPPMGEAIDPPAGSPNYPTGQPFSFMTPEGTIWFVSETDGDPFSPTLTVTVWRRVSAPAAS